MTGNAALGVKQGKSLGAGLGLAIAVGLIGCSASPASRPPLLADCQPNDAGCTTQSASGGGGGGSDDAAAVTCSGQDLSASSQCTQCAGLRCCSDLTTCLATTVCANLLHCLEMFGGLASGVAICNSNYGAGQATYNALELCLGGMCTVCGESGIGDPCAGNATGCSPGLMCIDGWCSAACTATTSCAGLGPNGGNALGLANACITIATTGDVCAPGCTTDSDCANFTGTFCLATTAVGGTPVQVCSHALDAGP